VTDLIERLQDMHHRQNRHSYSIGHYWNAVEEAADELERLRAEVAELRAVRESVEEFSHLKSDEIVRLQAELAELRADRERHLQDAEKVLDAFDSGLFIRDWDISRDHQSGWAMRYLKPLAALSRLHAAIEAARKKEV
jgi:DNA repair exonuclease SbcCD ATPase subunit